MIQDIEAKIKKDNPEFSIYLPEEPARPESSVDPALTAKRTLETRQVCHIPTDAAVLL